jgi:hypothetical protein
LGAKWWLNDRNRKKRKNTCKRSSKGKKS